MNRICLFLCVIVPVSLVKLADTTTADFVVAIQNATLSAGSSGKLDVQISSTGSDRLASASFEFRIESLIGNTQLRFTTPQLDAQLSEANYVFAAGSFKRDGDTGLGLPPSNVGNVSTVNYNNDTFIGSDDSAPILPTSYVALTGTNRLLVRLDVSPAVGLLSPQTGDQFRISLVSGPFTALLNDNLSPVNFTATAGIVNIAAVPEPTWLFIATLGGGFYWSHIRKRFLRLSKPGALAPEGHDKN